MAIPTLEMIAILRDLPPPGLALLHHPFVSFIALIVLLPLGLHALRGASLRPRCASGSGAGSTPARPSGRCPGSPSSSRAPNPPGRPPAPPSSSPPSPPT